MADEQKKRIYAHRLKVSVSQDEGAEIAATADRLGMSTSSYLRALGLGYQPLGQFDYQAIDKLQAVNADLSRMGNLLKLWLSDDAKLGVFKPGEAIAYIGRIQAAIHGNQVQIYEILQGVVRQGSPLRSRLRGKAWAPE